MELIILNADVIKTSKLLETVKVFRTGNEKAPGGPLPAKLLDGTRSTTLYS